MKGCCLMTNYLVTAKAEVLYEKAFSVLAKYSKYLDETKEPLECIRVLYESLSNYPDKIILCDNESSYDTLKKNIDEYENIIDNVSISIPVGA